MRSLTLARVAVAGVLGAAALPAVLAAPAPAATTWLCRPGLADDPCTPSLTTTRVTPTMRVLGVDRPRRVRDPQVDCFYVYPTVSNQPRPQATLRVDPELRSIALYQAARYSRDCRVFAPVYRQMTIQGLLNPQTVTPAMLATAYADVRDAWREYLARHNRGRGVVFVSHSQGTFILRALLAREVDRRPSIRRRLVSAILLGGQVTVRGGRDAGGDFRHIPACRAPTQLGCVIAFSTFGGPVPANAVFGRVTAQSGFGLRPPPPGSEILCTNPANLRGGAGDVTPILPTAPFAAGAIGTLTRELGFPRPRIATAWVEVPDAYRARCSTAGGADVLQIRPLRGAPRLRARPDAAWGLHLVDGNIALGELTEIVRRQIAAYARRTS